MRQGSSPCLDVNLCLAIMQQTIRLASLPMPIPLVDRQITLSDLPAIIDFATATDGNNQPITVLTNLEKLSLLL